MSLLKKKIKLINNLIKQIEEAAENKTLVYIVDYQERI